MEKNLSLVKVNALFSFKMLLIGTSSILTIYIGGIETANGNISIGNIATFLIFVNMLTWPVASLDGNQLFKELQHLKKEL